MGYNIASVDGRGKNFKYRSSTVEVYKIIKFFRLNNNETPINSRNGISESCVKQFVLCIVETDKGVVCTKYNEKPNVIRENEKRVADNEVDWVDIAREYCKDNLRTVWVMGGNNGKN